MNLARSAVRGATASGLGALLGFAVRFGANAFLARIIAPEIFGDFAMAWVYTELLAIASAAGFANCIVQFPDEGDACIAATLRLNGIAAALLIAGSACVALYVSVDNAPLGRLVLSLSTGRAITILSGVYDAVLQRDLEFARLARYRFFGILVSSSVALGLSFAEMPYTALASRELVGVFMPALLSLGRVRLPLAEVLRPSEHTREVTRRALNLGKEQFWVQALEVLYQRLDQFLLGKYLGTSELAFYSQARYLAGLPQAAVMPATQTVALRVFTGTAKEPERLRSILEAIQLLVAHVLALAAICFAAAPELLIQMAFGDRWLPAAAVLPYLAPWVVLLPLVRNAQLAHMALLRWTAIRRSQIVQFCSLVAVLPFGVYAFGSRGASIALSVALAAAMVVVARGFERPERPRVESYRGPLLGGAAAFVACVLWPRVDATHVAQLARLAAVQGAYIVVVLAFDGRRLKALARRIRKELAPISAPRDAGLSA